MNSLSRIRRSLAPLCIVAAFLSTSSVFAMEIDGVNLDEKANVAGQELRLNGAGIRHKFFFKVYVAALYLSEKKSEVPDILAMPGARRVAIVMRREVGSEEFGKAFLSGLTQNTDQAERNRLSAQLQKFGDLFTSIPELKKGDALTIDWIPNSGTLVQINGRKLADPFPDVGFYNALLKIWLGESPVDAKLKPLLLGEKS